MVFGGNAEAERKVQGLLGCDAAVTIVSPDLTQELERWAASGQITWIPRTYVRGDLRGAFLAIVSEPAPESTAALWEEAQAENVLLNAMDDVPHCSFVAGSVVRQGPLVLSISTSGCAPALAVRLRQRFEQTFGPAYAVFLAWMRALRTPMAEHFPNFEERRQRWYALVDSNILELLVAGEQDAARERVAEIVGEGLLPEAPAIPKA